MTTLRFWYLYFRAVRRLRGYRPKKVTFRSLARWAHQFPQGYRAELIRLVANMKFVSEDETIRWLVNLNKQVLKTLKSDGVTLRQVVYVTTDTAGSSSSVMLNLLRDRANLERQGATLLNSGEGEAIHRTTMKLKSGAIIYVDDFAGTGKQFVRSRLRVAEYIAGAFSEFFLIPYVCEEALLKCKAAGVETRFGFVHKRSQRPLRQECKFLPDGRREEIVALSRKKIGNTKSLLGFGGLATNVIFYRNAPNTTPLLFRGNLYQKPIHGVVPRFDDLELDANQK